MKTPILGSSYVARSVNAADARMVNLFPEIVPEGGKESAFLNRAPGLLFLTTVEITGPIRGMWTLGGYLYVVSGSGFYKMDSAYNSTFVGSVDNTTGGSNLPVVMCDNGVGSQVFIACNGPSYIYNTTTLAFAKITDDAFPGAVTVGYFDGFFVVNPPNSHRIYVSALLDGTTWDALAFSTYNGSDNVVGLIVDHKELWIYGTNSSEVWYDDGSQPFPFAPIQGATGEIGCASPHTICQLDNTVYWLSSDNRGHGVVYKATGYNGTRVSTHAVEWQIQQYGDLSNALAYTYQQDGHSFYVLVFPDQNTTWVYDVATQAWHERCGFSNGLFTRHQGNCHAFFNNLAVIGDYASGNLYSFDLNTYTDGPNIQKWLRSWHALPAGQNDLTRAAHHSLQLDCETGVGLNDGQGSDPQVMLRWSDDGGHTWSSEHWTSIAAIGAYGSRAIWRRLGMTLKLRDRVYEISGTDPVKISIVGAELHASGTNA